MVSKGATAMRLISEAKPTAGFTLLELLVVLTIAVGMTAAASTVLGPRAPGLEETSAEVMRILSRARHDALANGRDVQTVIDAKDGTLGRDGTVLLRLPETVSLHLPDTTERQSEIIFFAEGGATAAILRLRRGKLSHEIEVRWLTGAVNLRRDGIS